MIAAAQQASSRMPNLFAFELGNEPECQWPNAAMAIFTETQSTTAVTQSREVRHGPLRLI
jgi:hypothetical protein